jgi:hypothetical protein
MRRTLSSPFTLFWKFVLPAVLIGSGVYLIAMGWRGQLHHNGAPLSRATLLLVVPVLAAVFAWPLSWAKRLKRVEVDDRALYISNFITEVRVPLSDVTAVTESSSRKYFTVNIDLAKGSAFGQRIFFRPRFCLYWSGLHPIARELQALCKKARSEKGVGHSA